MKSRNALNNNDLQFYGVTHFAFVTHKRAMCNKCVTLGNRWGHWLYSILYYFVTGYRLINNIPVQTSYKYNVCTAQRFEARCFV